MSEYVTLVFRTETVEEKKKVRELSLLDMCRAWSMDHEMDRLWLIEEALENGDTEKAESYIGMVDVHIEARKKLEEIEG